MSTEQYEKQRKVKEDGFTVTKGRFVDIVMIAASVALLLFSLLSFITILASMFISSNVSEKISIGCVLFAHANHNSTAIEFGPNGPCIAICIAPLVIWIIIVPLTTFLLIKVWSAASMKCMVYIWTFILSGLFIYTLTNAIFLTIGEHLTCEQVASLIHPIAGNQACSQGGAYFDVSLGGDGYLRFDDLIDTCETGLWVSSILIIFLLLLYIIRCIWWTCRVINDKTTFATSSYKSDKGCQ